MKGCLLNRNDGYVLLLHRNFFPICLSKEWEVCGVLFYPCMLVGVIVSAFFCNTFCIKWWILITLCVCVFVFVCVCVCVCMSSQPQLPHNKNGNHVNFWGKATLPSLNALCWSVLWQNYLNRTGLLLGCGIILQSVKQ